MYGGSERNDYAAMKSSKNDMIGLMSYYNSKILGLCFPLMSLIDYRGFRLIAMSILPITSSFFLHSLHEFFLINFKQKRGIN